MNSGRFFRNVWRLNALLIMGVSIVGMVVLLYAAHTVLRDVFGSRHVHGVASVARDDETETVYRFGHVEEIPGTSFVMAPVIASRNYRHRYYGKEASALENVRFIDRNTLESRLLFPDNGQMIVQHAVLGNQDSFGRIEKAHCVLYVVVRDDTSGDDRLSSSDKIEIACSSPAGDEYVVLVDAVDEYLGYTCEDDRCLVLFRLGDDLHAVSFDTVSCGRTKREKCMGSVRSN